MAKIISFNHDAPSLKAEPKPHDGAFDLIAQLQHLSLGSGKDVQNIRVRASGGLLLYERRFAGRGPITAWLRSSLNMEMRQANQIADQIMAGGPVAIPVFFRKDELIEDRFKAVIS
jgi:hypothetical protein